MFPYIKLDNGKKGGLPPRVLECKRSGPGPVFLFKVHPRACGEYVLDA